MTHAVELVVVGGSAGAIEALREMLGGLGTDFSPAMAVVIHLPPDGPSLLPELLSRADGPPMKLAEDKEPIAGGTIYFAVPDYHLLVETGRTFALSQDERVHFSRPAIDVLFESAAEAYGDRLIGVVLSGANADGAEGLRAIAAAGGKTVVQSPDSAEMVAMPRAALEAVPRSLSMNLAALAEMFRAQGVDHGR